jgi:ubiquitin carboxyl-terminal hydrolase 5/13
MLEEMGFTRNQARKALRINNGNAEIAVAWLFENPDDAGEDAAPGETVGETSGESSVVPGSAELPAKYAIKSFISHKGPSVHSGHYVAHVRHDQDWTFFNDEKVVRAPLSSAAKEGDQDVGVKGLSQQAYVYFFERI